MASSPVKFLSALLAFASVGWIIFTFAARLLAWFLSRILRASVEFRVAGCNCIRDVSVKFPKGAVESLSVGEIKLSLRKSLAKLGFSFISGDPKLQLLICDLEVVTRPSERGVKNSKPSKTRKSRSGGRGKWMLLTNIARFFSISVTELAVKVPKASIEIKDLRIDISKDGGPNPVLNIKLCIHPLLVHMCNSYNSSDHSGFDQVDCFLTGQTSTDIAEKESVPLMFEDLSFSGEFGHDREQGIKIKSLDLTSGHITVNLNESMFLKAQKKKVVPIGSDVRKSSTSEDTTAKESQNDKLTLLMKKPIIPEKLQFT